MPGPTPTHHPLRVPHEPAPSRGLFACRTFTVRFLTRGYDVGLVDASAPSMAEFPSLLDSKTEAQAGYELLGGQH